MQITANEIDFVCQINGPEATPWLTFSNSLNTNFSLWDKQVALLSDRNRILRYNTRGHNGNSPTYVEIDPAGHLSIIENPKAFNAALFPFLDTFNPTAT